MSAGEGPDPASTVPPVGLAPEGEDFAHPWLISAIVSAICFAIGFGILYATGLWAKIMQWADAPFMFYFAILMPVLVGFTLYGIVITFVRLFRKPSKPAAK
ncbi:MAG: hypothetical protein KIS92_14525 [Planctomycetota bacterium]|nr:hypothetical protein [Planctomycetota bacterium]